MDERFLTREEILMKREDGGPVYPKAQDIVCSCGARVRNGEYYYIFRGEIVCPLCLDSYLDNYASNGRLRA